jgi:hypothetical protein
MVGFLATVMKSAKESIDRDVKVDFLSGMERLPRLSLQRQPIPPALSVKAPHVTSRSVSEWQDVGGVKAGCGWATRPSLNHILSPNHYP